jgi:hypothetical protein
MKKVQTKRQEKKMSQAAKTELPHWFIALMQVETKWSKHEKNRSHTMVKNNSL